MSAITIEKLFLRYGEQEVLRGIDLEIPENVCFAIMGPSGCGKSSLLKVLNRLVEMNHNVKISGDVKLFGNSIFKMDLTKLRRQVGMVFQIPNPFPHMSIYDNITYAVKCNGIAKKKEELDKIVEWALKKAALFDEVKDRLKMRANQLSGGQMQRLCIARALALKPRVMLMDEPTANLDPISADKIEDLITELKNEYTIVMVTHSPGQAARVSDFVAFLYMGRVIEVGKTEEVFENPKNELTERYVTGRIG
ncbi:MAG: phosphate ABC transporter ATP-binding protein [Archaeoglobi archaeon]|jgi:phosphate transport system ATP-binding protein|nr:MAG: phosphate ABC transporter ATP-binding protein [Archaeoglobi archaeon]